MNFPSFNFTSTNCWWATNCRTWRRARSILRQGSSRPADYAPARALLAARARPNIAEIAPVAVSAGHRMMMPQSPQRRRWADTFRHSIAAFCWTWSTDRHMSCSNRR